VIHSSERLARETHHRQQAVILDDRRRHAVGHDEVAIALLLGQAVGVGGIRRFFEQHDRCVTTEHTFDRALPFRIRHFDDVRQHGVRNAFIAQRAAHQALRFGLGHRALALQLGDRRQLARDPGRYGFARALLARELGFFFAQLLAHFSDVGTRIRRQLLQAVTLLQQAFQRFQARVHFRQTPGQFAALLLELRFLLLRVGQRPLLAGQLAAFLGQLTVGLHQRLFRFAQRARDQKRFLARFVVLQRRQHFFVQLALFLVQVGPLMVVGHAQAQTFEVGARRFQLGLEALEFCLSIALVALGFVVGVQHFLVAKDLEHQVEQLARRVFAQLVGLALLERQHFRHRRRQAGRRQALAVVFHAQPVGRFGHFLDLDVPGSHQVLALPVAAILLHLAKERDFIVGEKARMAKRPVRQLAAHRLVVDDGAQPGALLARVARVVFVRAAHRAIEPEQRAHRVEQRRLARAVLAGDRDDLGVERDVLDPLPVIPVDQFE
jgi:hypothetical protein